MALNKVFVIVTICLLTGFLIGYAVGSAMTINWVIDKGVSFMEQEGLNISIDKAQLQEIINRYKVQIDVRYPG